MKVASFGRTDSTSTPQGIPTKRRRDQVEPTLATTTEPVSHKRQRLAEEDADAHDARVINAIMALATMDKERAARSHTLDRLSDTDDDDNDDDNDAREPLNGASDNGSDPAPALRPPSGADVVQHTEDRPVTPDGGGGAHADNDGGDHHHRDRTPRSRREQVAREAFYAAYGTDDADCIAAKQFACLLGTWPKRDWMWFYKARSNNIRSRGCAQSAPVAGMTTSTQRVVLATRADRANQVSHGADDQHVCLITHTTFGDLAPGSTTVSPREPPVETETHQPMAPNAPKGGDGASDKNPKSRPYTATRNGVLVPHGVGVVYTRCRIDTVSRVRMRSSTVATTSPQRPSQSKTSGSHLPSLSLTRRSDGVGQGRTTSGQCGPREITGNSHAPLKAFAQEAATVRTARSPIRGSPTLHLPIGTEWPMTPTISLAPLSLLGIPSVFQRLGAADADPPARPLEGARHGARTLLPPISVLRASLPHKSGASDDTGGPAASSTRASGMRDHDAAAAANMRRTQSAGDAHRYVDRGSSDGTIDPRQVRARALVTGISVCSPTFSPPLYTDSICDDLGRKPVARMDDAKRRSSWSCDGTVSRANDQLVEVRVGEWKDGRQHGRGSRVVYAYTTDTPGVYRWLSVPYSYCGPFVDGLEHGLGTVRYADHSVFIGRFARGRRDGDGVLIDADGTITVGRWHGLISH